MTEIRKQKLITPKPQENGQKVGLIFSKKNNEITDSYKWSKCEILEDGGACCTWIIIMAC